MIISLFSSSIRGSRRRTPYRNPIYETGMDDLRSLCELRVTPCPTPPMLVVQVLGSGRSTSVVLHGTLSVH